MPGRGATQDIRFYYRYKSDVGSTTKLRKYSLEGAHNRPSLMLRDVETRTSQLSLPLLLNRFCDMSSDRLTNPNSKGPLQSLMLIDVHSNFPIRCTLREARWLSG